VNVPKYNVGYLLFNNSASTAGIV